MKKANLDTKGKADEKEELLKTALEAVRKLEEERKSWKSKCVQYKELAARGHRVGEKRASMCVSSQNEGLAQTQNQLDREKKSNAELKEKILELEHQIRVAKTDFDQRLEAEERRFAAHFSDREAEYQEKIVNLEEIILKQKENRIKVTNSTNFVQIIDTI